MYLRAKKLGYDAIVLMTGRGKERYTKKQKAPVDRTQPIKADVGGRPHNKRSLAFSSFMALSSFLFVPVTPALLSMYSSVIGLTTISPSFS